MNVASRGLNRCLIGSLTRSLTRVLIQSPLGRCQSLHRQRMNLLAHAVAQSLVNLLVSLDAAGTLKFRRHDGGEEMAAVTVHRNVFANHAVCNEVLDF